MYPIQKLIKYAGLGLLCAGATTLIYNYFRQNSVNDFFNVTKAELKSVIKFNEKNFIEIISSIEPSQISQIQAYGLVQLIKLIDESDLETVLKLIGSIASFSNNIIILCESGCVDCLVKVFKQLNEGVYNEKIIISLMLCLRTLACNDMSSEIFMEYIDEFISCIYMKQGTLSENCLIILGNLTLYSNVCDKMENNISDVIQWINSNIKSINGIKAFQILLHLSTNSDKTRLAILQSKGDFQFVITFIWTESQISTVRSSLIFLNLMYRNLIADPNEIVPGTLNQFLLSNCGTVKTRVKELCFSEDEEVRQRSTNLNFMMEKFEF